MISNQEKPLKILSASAGSGKTYNLVLTYLKLILNEEEHPEIFSSIIAMTFTNKAASEMKSRIIDALNLLSSKNPEDKKAANFLKDISEKLNIPPEKIKFRSALVLKHILHQYENFSVLTIDKFNLRLIRSFSRDLNINNDFQTTTNEQEILSQLVDQIYGEINGEHKDSLTEIALKLSHERFEEEGKWDFKKDLNEFVAILLKEQNLEIIASILEQDFSLKRYDELKTNLRKIKKEIQDKASELHRVFFSHDTSKFPGASTTEKAFEKLKNIFDSKPSDSGYYFSNTIYNAFLEDPKNKAFPEEIKSKGLEFVRFYIENSVYVEQLTKFLSQYFFIAIIQIIAKELQSFKKSENIVLISEFNKLISDLLKDEYAPYIYERIGNRYKHFLLDEFQDTSRLQWINLIPLVHESLGKAQTNLIVGDPKQSIYRFKNGLAEQFVTLPKIYNPENDSKLAESSHFFDQMGKMEPLADNWRSKKEIVEFNNRFFEVFKNAHPDIIGQFYTDIKQNPKAKDGGYVYFESELSESKSSEYSSEDDEEEVLESEYPFLLSWINECLASGYDYGDICILDYTKTTCNSYANYLISKGLTVVSTDSLLLGGDIQVKLMVQFIKWRNNPSSDAEARKFSEMYFDYKTHNAIESLKKYWKKIEKEEKSFYIFDASQFLKDEFQSEENFFFHFENLYQLVQKAFVLFGFDEFASPYLHQFSDYVFLFDQNYGPALNLFIEFYEKDGHKTPVVIPENKDAIKIMTGHKSKGLEFPIVMIPSLNWSILQNQAKFLIQDEKFVYYTSLSKNSKIKAIADKHKLEYNQATLDKVNLNYVMFTRPEDRLYIRNVSTKKAKEFQKIIHNVLKDFTQSDDAKIVFESGNKSNKEEKVVSLIADSKFFPKESKDHLWFPEISLQNNEVIGQDAISEQRRFGNQLHEVLALTIENNELEKLIQELVLKGKIERDFEEKILVQARQILSYVEYQSLFEVAIEILREQDIMLSENESKRPDLIIRKNNETIILDYKTGLENPKYAKQLRTYCNTLSEMGFENVSGIIFYTNNLKLVNC
jgi:ATP-dependent exoDNAse (exonuclease V) beta subunit